MLTKRVFKLGWIVAAGLFWSGQAHSVVITQSISLGTSSSFAGAPALGSQAQYDLFDPSLGVLNHVDVRILGSWQGTGSFSCVCIPSPRGPVPTPYVVAAQFTQEIDGLGSGSDLGFLLPPTIHFNAHVVNALNVGVSVFYDMGFRFDAGSDAFGLASVSGGSSAAGPFVTSVDPPVVQGLRTDFVGAGPAFFLNRWQSSFQVLAAGSPTATLSYQYHGSMILTYDYTPHGNSEPPVTVDEPATAGLVALGLLVALLSRRRQVEPRAR